MLKLENITGGYNANRDILAGLSLHVRRGESVGVIGLNGSGKSTLGKAIMNRLPCRGGRVFWMVLMSRNFPPPVSSIGVSLVFCRALLYSTSLLLPKISSLLLIMICVAFWNFNNGTQIVFNSFFRPPNLSKERVSVPPSKTFIIAVPINLVVDSDTF